MDNYDGNPFEEQMRLFEAETGQGGPPMPPPPFSRPSFLPASVRTGAPPPPTFARPSTLAKAAPAVQKEYAAAPVISKPAEDDEDVFSTLLKYEKEVRAEKKEKKLFEKAKKAERGSKESTPTHVGSFTKATTPTPVVKVTTPLQQQMLKISGTPMVATIKPPSAKSSGASISADPVRTSKPGTEVTPDEIMQTAKQMVDLVKASQVIETKRLQIPSTRQVGGMGTQTTNWATGKVIPSSSASEASVPTISGHKQTKKPKKMIRVAGGQVWEDQSLLNWDINDFRLFCGDLGNDVTDEVLTRTFSRYPSFQMAKVVRDKRSNKTKGYGFVSFKDPSDFTRAIKEMDGKYVGSRPIKLRKSNWKDRNVDIVKGKQKMKQQMGYKY